MSKPLVKYIHTIIVLVFILFLQGCATPLEGVDPSRTARRELCRETPWRSNGLSVKEFLAVSGFLAADLSSCSVVQEATKPIVIEIRCLEDGTAPEIKPAPYIYAAAIREKLLNMGHGMLAFRNRRVYNELYADSFLRRFSTPAGKEEISARLAKLAKVDYWLSGFIYYQDDINPMNDHRYRYYRIHFMLSDVDTGLIAWEKHYDLKNYVLQ